MSRPTNAEEARIYLDEVMNFPGLGDTPTHFIAIGQACALLALAGAADSVADAIREHTARTTHPAGKDQP